MSSTIRKIESSSIIINIVSGQAAPKHIECAINRIAQLQGHLSSNSTHSFGVSDASSQIDVNPTSGKVIGRAIPFPKELHTKFEKVIGLNINNAENADFYFLCDTHDAPLGRLFLDVIHTYGKPGDFVVLESFESLQSLRPYFEELRKDRMELEETIAKIEKSMRGKTLSASERENLRMQQEILTHLKKEDTLENMCLILAQEGYNLVGWDNEKARRACIQITEKQIEIEQKYCQLLNQAIKPTLLSEKLTLEDIAARKHWKILSELATDPNKHEDLASYAQFLGFTYSLVLNNLAASVLPPHCTQVTKLLGASPKGLEMVQKSHKLCKADDKNMFLRDQSLDKTAITLHEKYPDKKIFVIGGEWHFTKHIAEYDDLGKKETNILEKFAEYKCVLAYPKL